MKKWSLMLACVAAAWVVSAGPQSFVIAQDTANYGGGLAVTGTDAAARLDLADSILAAREAAAGRPLDSRYRASLRASLAGLPIEQLESIQKTGELNLNELVPNAFGDPAADLVYTPVTPCRVFDTRSSAAGILAADTQQNFKVAGTASLASQGGSASGCGIPLGPATSVVINFAAVTPTGAGNLRAWAVASPQPAAPLAAVMNFSPALYALANGVAVPICNVAATTCASDLRLQADVSSVHIVGDVLGYFARPTSTVTVYRNDSTTGAQDPDLTPNVCQTADFTPATNVRAVISGAVCLLTAGAMNFTTFPKVSSDGGATFTYAGSGNFGRAGASAAGVWACAPKFMTIDLTAGTQYRFAMEIGRDSGTADATSSRCETHVQLFPR